jgi:hypothetical protein
MKKSLLFASIIALAGMASASTNYSFSTTGSYTPGTGTVDTTSLANSCNINLCVDWAAGTDPNTDALFLQMVYTPFSNSGVATQVDSFGTVQLFCVDIVGNNNADTHCTGSTAVDGGLTVTVNQTVPGVESSSFVDALAGTAAAGATLHFGASSFNLDGGVLTYSLQQPANYLVGAVGSGATSLQGIVTENSVSTPEPATLGMLGAGLLGLGIVARKRKA